MQGNRFDHTMPEVGANANALCPQLVVFGHFRLLAFQGSLGITLVVCQLLLEVEKRMKGKRV
jgi:hypothetical protein